ncbi:MAG: hypothetical protein RR185_08910 [Angelakisella sp.]
MGKSIRDTQLEYYGKKIPGLAAFANIWLPVITAFAFWGLCTSNLSEMSALTIAIKLIYPLFSLITTIVIRAYDKGSYYTSLCYLVYIAILYLYRSLSMFFSSFDVFRVFGDAAANTDAVLGTEGIISGIVGAGAAIGTGIIIISTLFTLAIVLFFSIYYISIFVVHRKFFLTPFLELKKQYQEM